jgi:uncharacterized protein
MKSISPGKEVLYTTQMRKVAAPIVILLIAICGIFIFNKITSHQPNFIQLIPTPTSSPLPFLEMTIPYLRQRSYDGKLGALEVFATKNTYTSYLTSYESDGLKINALLTKPEEEIPPGGWPAVVFIHGYVPPKQYQTTEKYVDYVDYLSQNGFVVFKIDLRGHGDSEGDPGGAYYSSDYVIDVLNAYAALQSSDFVNPNQVALWGHSMAGNITLRALAVKPDIPSAVIWAGAGYSYSDLLRYGISDASYRPLPSSSPSNNKRQQLMTAHGSFNPNNAFWKQVAPTNYLSDLKGAIQLHHAVDDSVVNIAYSRDLNDLLNQTNVPHELYEYQTGGHNITGESFSEAMQRTVDFYKRSLKGDSLSR